MTNRIENQRQPESNLTPITRIVNNILMAYVTPALRDKRLVAAANEIADQKLPPEDLKCIDFAIRCKQLSIEITDKLRIEGKTKQEIAIVNNYLDSLARNTSKA